MSSQMKRVTVLFLEFLAGLAGNLVAGWIQRDLFSDVFSTERIIGTIVGALIMLVVIAWIERPIAVVENLDLVIATKDTLHSPAHNTNEEEIGMLYDVFISHASEDKDTFVRPLAVALDEAGYKVWYDEFSLQLGDSLPTSVDYGLANSRYGIVVLSVPFFEKNWPMAELDGLFMRQMAGKKVILPIWHGVSQNQVLSYSPLLASKLALSTGDKSVEQIVTALGHVLNQP